MFIDVDCKHPEAVLTPMPEGLSQQQVRESLVLILEDLLLLSLITHYALGLPWLSPKPAMKSPGPSSVLSTVP